MYSIRSVDVNEMWGPHDTIERLQYNNKDLDFGYKWICKEREDYIKVNWIVSQLNKRDVSLDNLDKALYILSISWKKIRFKMYEKYWRDLANNEKCPYKKKQYLENIKISRLNKKLILKAEKWRKLSRKIPILDLCFLEGYDKSSKRVVPKKYINYYNRIKKHRFYICSD